MDFVLGSGVDDFGFSSFDKISPLKGFFTYATCVYNVVTLVSIGLFFKRSSWFPWMEMIRCLTFLGYQLQFRTFAPESGGYSLLMNSFRLLHLYSAVKCQVTCVNQIRDAMQKKNIKRQKQLPDAVLTNEK